MEVNFPNFPNFLGARTQVGWRQRGGARAAGGAAAGGIRIEFLNFLNFRGIRNRRKFPSEAGLGVTGLPAYNTGHHERYLADGSRPPRGGRGFLAINSSTCDGSQFGGGER